MNEEKNNENEDRLVSGESQENQEIALRPRKLDEFIGQGLSRRNLETFIAASVQRQDSLDHTLLHGPPGLGKTTMAQIIASFFIAGMLLRCSLESTGFIGMISTRKALN